MYEEFVLYGYDEWEDMVYLINKKYPSSVIKENKITLNGKEIATVREEEYDIILKVIKGII